MIFKRTISFTLIFTISVSMFTLSANAMENGFDAPIDGRTVPIIVQPMGIVCTGFLYSERIVFTAGHCLHNMQTKQRYENVLIGAPNEVFTSNSKTTAVLRTFVASNWENFGWSDEINFNPTGEFGIYILKEPIKVSGIAEVASLEKLNQLTAAKSMVTNVAYGKQRPNDSDSGLPSRSAKYAEFPIVPYETAKSSIDGALNWSGKKKYNMTFHVLQVPTGPSTCSGDSGSPFYVKESDKFIYIGAVSNGLGGAPNCSGKPWGDTKMYVGAAAAYDYLDLIAQAEKYIADNPYIEPKSKTAGFNNKITITCVKGKTTKKVSGITPKCPVGYKKK